MVDIAPQSRLQRSPNGSLITSSRVTRTPERRITFIIRGSCFLCRKLARRRYYNTYTVLLSIATISLCIDTHTCILVHQATTQISHHAPFRACARAQGNKCTSVHTHTHIRSCRSFDEFRELCHSFHHVRILVLGERGYIGLSH